MDTIGINKEQIKDSYNVNYRVVEFTWEQQQRSECKYGLYQIYCYDGEQWNDDNANLLELITDDDSLSKRLKEISDSILNSLTKGITPIVSTKITL